MIDLPFPKEPKIGHSFSLHAGVWSLQNLYGPYGVIFNFASMSFEEELELELYDLLESDAEGEADPKCTNIDRGDH